MGSEMAYRAADFGNNLLYLGSGGRLGWSNLNLSQMSQLQASGQTTWARATFSAVPVVGSGYNFVMGEDLLTGRSLTGLDRAGAGFGLLADVSFVAAGGLKLTGYNPALRLPKLPRWAYTQVAPKSALSRGAQLRAQYGATFEEYMQYRGQAFTPAQAKYLTEAYEGIGHHFIARRYGLPEVISESPLNVMKSNGISIGQFYERHFLADPYFYGTKFPSSIGGSWSGSTIGLQKPGFMGRLWYGSSGALKVTAGAGAAAGGAGLYWWLSSDDK
jgi:hypothetical protein